MLDAERVGLLVESDRMLFAAVETPHDDARQAVGALQPDQPVGEHEISEDEDARSVRDEIAPLRASGIRKRSHHDLEVFGVVGIGKQDQHGLAEE